MRFPCRHSICSYLLGTNTSSDYLVRNYMLQTYTDTSAPYNYIIPDHNMALRAQFGYCCLTCSHCTTNHTARTARLVIRCVIY
jgi:hypothetical protein